MAKFKWNKKRQKAAIMLADGEKPQKAADEIGVSKRTIYRWLDHPDFADEVDRLVMMTGISLRSERIKIAKQAIKARIANQQFPRSQKDLLDWLKYAQGETDGVKLDLATFLDLTIESLAGTGSAGSGEDKETD